jgi:hypothetical protein
MAFLEFYLNADTPTTSRGDSVCSEEAQPSKPYNPNDLFFDTKADIQDQQVRVTSEMSPRVDQVVFVYAVDLTSPLKPFLGDRGYVPYEEEYLYLKGGNA